MRQPDSNAGEAADQATLRDRALESTVDGIVITDPRQPDNPIVYVNPGFTRLTGYPREEALGRNCRFLQGPDTDPAGVAEVRDALREEREVRVILQNYRRDGSAFWNYLSVSPVRDDAGQLTHFVGVQVDVTEQIHRQEELRLQERAVAAAKNGILICDARQPDSPIIYCNRAFTEMTGYEESEALGRNCRFLQGADTDPQTRARLRQAVRNAQDCLAIIKNYRKDGTPFWNELTISPVRDARGRLSHFIGVQTDITEHRRTEEENARLLTEVQNTAAQQRAFLRDILASVTEGRLRLCEAEEELPAPLPIPATDEPIPLTMESLRYLRRATTEAAVAAGLSDERWQDLVAGIGEAAMNAVVHAGGGEAMVYRDDHQIQVWIQDHGGGISMENLPRATLERGYTTAGTMGHGFWLMLKTCDACWLLTNPAGTTVVLQQGQTPPRPPWLQYLD
jgi:PAS domain S-box-containing protein